MKRKFVATLTLNYSYPEKRSEDRGKEGSQLKTHQICRQFSDMSPNLQKKNYLLKHRQFGEMIKSCRFSRIMPC